MAIAYRASANGPTTASTTASITVPASVQAGDLMLVGLITSDTDAMSISGGGTGVTWTEKDIVVTGGRGAQLYWGVAVSDSAGSTISLTGGTTNTSAILNVYSGVDTATDPFDAFGFEGNGSGDNTMAQITTVT